MQTLYLFCSYVKWEGSRLTHGIFPCVGYTKLLERHLEDKNISDILLWKVGRTSKKIITGLRLRLLEVVVKAL